MDKPCKIFEDLFQLFLDICTAEFGSLFKTEITEKVEYEVLKDTQKMNHFYWVVMLGHLKSENSASYINFTCKFIFAMPKKFE